MRRRLAGTAGCFALFMAGVAAAAPAIGSAVSFVACPVARDTGPDTDVCFSTEHDGVVYALSNPADWGMPQLKHRVLVEGVVRAGPNACGGLPLDGRVSVLPEIDAACDRILPFDGVIVGVAGGVFNSGPAEQRARMVDLARRAQGDEPALSVQPVAADPALPAPFSPPFEAKAFTIYYPFASDRASGPDMMEIVNLVRYAQASNAQVRILSRQGASRLMNGETLSEPSGTAKRRAEKLSGIMVGLGAAANAVTAETLSAAPAPDGVEDWRDRRIEVVVVPHGGSNRVENGPDQK
jgi:hypothetical protein